MYCDTEITVLQTKKREGQENENTRIYPRKMGKGEKRKTFPLLQNDQ